VKKIIKIVSIIIVITMLTSIIPSKSLAVMAAPKEKAKTEVTKKSYQESKEKEEPKIVREITEKREQNIKHFLNEDLSYQAVVYNYPVHYKENGEWKDIDNTLEDASDETFGIKENLLDADGLSVANDNETNKAETTITDDKSSVKEKVVNTDSKVNLEAEKKTNKNNVIKNKQNNFSVSFSKDSKATDKLVKLQKDRYELTWGVEKPGKSSAEVISIDKAKLEKESEETVNKKLESEDKYKNLSKDKKEAVKSILIENEKKKTVENSNSSMKYSNVYPDVDFKYDILGDLIKENIIVNKPKANLEFNFNLNAKGLVPKLQSDKSIIFYDEKDSSKAVFKMNAPYMFDKNNSTSSNIEISLAKAKQGYILNLKPDSKWLNDSKRVYPVTIDPPVETSLDIKDIQDTYVSSIDPENKYNSIFFRAGNVTNLGVMRSYLKFTLPQLKSSDTVTGAQLNCFVNDVQNGGVQVNAHKVLSDWNSSALSWGNKPDYNSKIEDFQVINTYGWTYFNVTSIAKEWYNSGNNYGLMLKSDNESSGVVTFRSSDTTDVIARPSVSIFYVSNVGLESYWTYHSQNVGRAGTVYTNDFNGNLIHIHNDLSMTGNKMPTSINHIYNSSEVYKNYGIGAGWRLSVSQRIGWLNSPDGGYYTYTDEDGTVHYFKWEANTTEYKEELGLELTLSLVDNSVYVLKDKKSNKLIFSGDGYPISMQDNNGNTSTLQYETASGTGSKILTKIIDGANRSTSLVYNSVAGLDHITDPNGNTTTYQYTNGNLTKIIYPDGKYSTYNYDSNNYLTEAINFDGYMSGITYSNVMPKKVIKIAEKNTNGTQGKELNIDYGYNTTRFTEYTGKKSIYQFNNSGQTVSMKDDNGNALYNNYNDSTNITKLSEGSKQQKSINNLFVNHSAEGNEDIYAGADGGSGTSGYTTAAYYLGDRSIIVAKNDNVSRQYMQQVLSLEKGKTYNFSSYVKTSGVSSNSNGGARLGVHYQDKNGQYQEIESKYITGTNDWARIDTSFTLPIDAESSDVILRTYLENESGTAYFDAMQLEEGSIANRYNIIVNSDLSGTGQLPNYWGNHGLDSNDSLIDSTDKDHPSSYNNRVFKLNGAAGKDAKIGQGTNINGKVGDSFVVSAWGKGASVPRGSFCVQAVFVGVDGNNQWETISFNNDSNDWQYVSKPIKAKVDFVSVDVYLAYGNNANEAYFDGIQLYKEEFGESYTYDEKGNLVSASDLAKQKSSFEYNGTNDLLKATDPKGSSFSYEYYDNHNIKTAKTAENVVYSFEYDSDGNPTVSKIGDSSTLLIKATAAYTPNGNYIQSMTDSSGNTVTYNYDQADGTLDSVKDAKGNTTSYVYEGYQNNLKSVTNGTVTNSYTYKNDKIDTITHNGFSYRFGYDSLGNNTTVAVGSNNLITNRFEDRSGKLLDSTYGNGQKVSSDYDGQDRVIAQKVAGDNAVGVTYQSYVQNKGWLSSVQNGSISGTVGESLRMEALKISLTNPLPNMQIKYQVHVQNKGWMDLKSSGETAGTIGEALRIEAIKIKLEGAPEGYRVRYQVQVEGYGWMDPEQDGEIAGTLGKGLRIEAIKVDVDKYRYAYKYDAAGNLAYEQDVVNGVNYKYVYDTANRLVRTEDSKGNNLSYGYDLNNNINTYSEKVSGSTFDTNYTFDKDNKQKTISYNRPNLSTITFNYDSIGRTYEKLINTGTANYKTSYAYTAGVAGQTTTKVGAITNGTDAISYTYDANGNIETITRSGKVIKYTYNSLNELQREDNQELNKTIVYAYDNGGNIATKTEYAYTTGAVGTATKVYSYLYGDTNWKDKLTSYDGKAITYDNIGNPLTYNGYTYTWEQGRQLKSINGNGQTIAYKYNSSGIRTEKTVNGVVTKYHLVGDKVTYEESGTDKIYYTYDSSGNLVSMNLNNVEYYYIRNAQGDIIGLIDKNGSQVVSYSYDSWGKVVSVGGTLASTVGAKNPYRYRGYRYDSETQLYYLNSRYYSHELGRFINSDGIIGQAGEILGHNLFAYGKNNHINMSDPNGFRPIYTEGEETDEMLKASLAVMATAASNNASNSTITNGSSSFRYKDSAIKGTKSGTIDKIGEVAGGTFIKEKNVWKNYGAKGLGGYASNLGKGAKFGKKTLGIAGTIGFTAWDAGNSVLNGEYVGAGIDILSGILGFGAGVLIGVGSAALITAGAPAVLMGGLGFGVCVGAGVFIDWVATGTKDKYYGR
jgi:RHS repeat-associated protein